MIILSGNVFFSPKKNKTLNAPPSQQFRISQPMKNTTLGQRIKIEIYTNLEFASSHLIRYIVDNEKKKRSKVKLRKK